jgi:hypothetical protein
MFQRVIKVIEFSQTSMPLLSSTTSCQHTVDQRLLAGVTCEEHHDLRRVLAGGDAAGMMMMMRIQQILQLIRLYVPPPPAPTISNNSTRNNDFFEEEEEKDEEEKEEEILKIDETNSPWIISQTIDEAVTDLINFSPEEEEEEEEENVSRRRERSSLLFEHSKGKEDKIPSSDIETGRKALSTFCLSLKVFFSFPSLPEK